MSSVVIEGGKPLCGEVCIQGSKNAVLPVLAAVILTDGMTRLRNCPRITDVDCILEMLCELGCLTCFTEDGLIIDTKGINCFKTGRESAGRTRASILMLGAMLGRFRSAIISYPGGCTIGNRPIDIHLSALEKMGAFIEPVEDALYCTANSLHGAEICLPFPSVGATENIILAAVLADGVTKLSNAAREPEICALCDYLRLAGAKICGDGSSTIVIEGVKRLTGVSYQLPYDRIVAGTYLTSVAAAGGDAVICGVIKEEHTALLELLTQCGCNIKHQDEVCWIKRKGPLKCATVVTAPFPGFPTDMQSQVLAMFTHAEGKSSMEERIFESRFQICDELKKMGADISVQGCQVSVCKSRLQGADVTAFDLRGGAGLCIAGLMAEGCTSVKGMEYINRGYEDICRDIKAIGGTIKLLKN